MDLFHIIFAVLAGLAIGSFINVLVYRIPQDINIIKPDSFCPNCSHKLSWADKIPVVSYVLLKGRCRYCKESVPLMYPVTEILTAALFAALYLKFGQSLLFIKYAVFICFVIAVSVTDIFTSAGDFETGMIPVAYPVAGIAAAIVFSVVEGGFGYYMAGISAGYLVLFFPAFIYAKIRKREGIGEGDFLFFAMIGAFTGLGSIAAILTVASFLGVVAGFMVIFVAKDKNYPVPFAPMLGVAAIIYVFFEDMLNFYNWSGRFIFQ